MLAAQNSTVVGQPCSYEVTNRPADSTAAPHDADVPSSTQPTALALG